MATDADFVNNIPAPNSGANAMQCYTQLYTYDAHGNMLTIPHLSAMEWDSNDRQVKTIMRERG